MCTDLGTFFDHGDHQVLFELFKANGAGQACWPRSDDDYVIIHDFTFSRIFAHLDSRKP